LGKFRIGRYPVTVFEYGKFVEAGGPEPYSWEDQSRWPHRPVVRVNWQQAVDYCEWAGCRLATSDEWERAAAGKEGREYPWGSEEPDDQRANFDMRVGRVTPVGLFPAGNTPDGVADLAGNVSEWTGTDYDASRKVVRGGAFFYDARALRAAFRGGYHPEDWYFLIGFRCVRE
jgi:formylglycine-generating enzyme required for sulfatase activity